ncbi:hypothetical protein LPJ68_000939 [Coemansia sp. RSA 1086]|nr:hypothetical protein LPJ68_000939 [Coemansia sp. RSA 1086]
MNPNYSFPPPLNHNRQNSSNSTSAFGESPTGNQTTCVSYEYPKPVDIPKGRKRQSQEVALQGESRGAGIGGFSSFYHRSGIGNNTTDDRNSGIGKLCYEEGGSRLSGSFSSFRRLSLRKSSIDSQSSEEAKRRGSQASVASHNSGSKLLHKVLSKSNLRAAHEQSSDVHVDVDASSLSSDHSLNRDARKSKHNLHKFWHF